MKYKRSKLSYKAERENKVKKDSLQANFCKCFPQIIFYTVWKSVIPPDPM